MLVSRSLECIDTTADAVIVTDCSDLERDLCRRNFEGDILGMGGNGTSPYRQDQDQSADRSPWRTAATGRAAKDQPTHFPQKECLS
jgi:hypothetical protein